MSKKRERVAIIHDILTAIMEKGSKIKPTHILYKSNLSSDMLKQYLGELLEKEFVVEETDKKGKKLYSLLPKGFNYLKEYSVIKNFMESYGLE